MNESLELHAYLAGPDVFYPNAVEMGNIKKATLAALGIMGHFPFDNELDTAKYKKPHERSFAIGEANERTMLECCGFGRFGIILANMIPFRGPSMDVGTAFEVGFMSALAETRKNVLIVGYTNDLRPFEDRVVEAIYGDKKHITKRDGFLYGPDGLMIESYEGAENLMLTHAIEKTGGVIVEDFESAATLAKELTDKRIRAGHI